MRASKSKNQGFTLIELMVVVAIIGIIAAVALPSYLESVNKSRRGEAKAEMTALAQQLERCFTRNNSYVTGCGLTNGTVVDTDGKNHKITLATSDLAYTLTAVPQYTDSRCGTLTLDHVGAKTSNANDYCW